MRPSGHDDPPVPGGYRGDTPRTPAERARECDECGGVAVPEGTPVLFRAGVCVECGCPGYFDVPGFWHSAPPDTERDPAPNPRGGHE